MEDALAGEFLRVTEQASIAAARTVGMGDAPLSDRVAVESMRREMESIDVNGTIVIGEGERDKAPMLYIGESVGSGNGPEVDIAVDPLEGTNLCARGESGAIAVMAVAEKNGLLNAPDVYMEKIIVGPSARGRVRLDATVEENLNAMASGLGRKVSDLTIVIMDRPRHYRLMEDVRKAGARIHLIRDGDLSAGIAAAVRGTSIHAVMGIGGAPEGVLTAAAMRCLGGEIQGRLIVPDEETRKRMKKMGIPDPDRIYGTHDLAGGKHILFVATGITDGSLLEGVRLFGDGIRTHSLLMRSSGRQVRFVDTIHVGDSDTGIRF